MGMHREAAGPDRADFLNRIEQVIAQGPFTATWESLGAFSAPDWYRRAKFGVFIHWGPYSVPAFGNEWYPRNMYRQGTPEYKHHVATYGPHKAFGYKDFIPLFRGERFDATEWMRLFAEAGARYVVPVAEHHDGYQMYDSALSEWNAACKGPCRDVLGELREAAEQHGIRLGASSHRIEHWFFMGHGKEFDSDIREPLTPKDLYWPSMPEAGDLQDIASEPEPSRAFMEDWLLRCCELIDRYRPGILYFDWWIQHRAAKPYLKKLAAYYYNRAAEWGIEVAINYKNDAFMFGCAVPDIERGQCADMKPYFWQTDTAVAKNSWCYTEGNEYKTAREILCDLVDIVSRNGTLLLNVGPKADGTIPEQDTAILREIGAWLKVNGEAVYDTGVWRRYGEGPTLVREGHFSDQEVKTFTSQDIRFTCKNDTLYATVLVYPADGEVCIQSLAQMGGESIPLFHGLIRDVRVLGFAECPVWRRDAQGLHLRTEQVVSDKPVVFRIGLD